MEAAGNNGRLSAHETKLEVAWFDTFYVCRANVRSDKVGVNQTACWEGKIQETENQFGLA